MANPTIPSFTPGKRLLPSDSEDTPLHAKQTERQTKQRQNSGHELLIKDLDLSTTLINPEVFNDPTLVEKLTVGELNKVVSGILTEGSFLKSLTGMICNQLTTSMNATITAVCQKAIEPYAKKIDYQAQEIKDLKSKINSLERGLEEQQQYSRRTSLRFNNVRLPTDATTNKIIFPVDTDSIVLDICNSALKQPIKLEDIGRSHTIGKIQNGTASIIVRFLSYRKRQMVYSNKRLLRNHPDETFISENLTKERFGILRKLNVYRKKHHIDSYWTQDGRIIVKPDEHSDRREFVTIVSEDEIFNKLGLSPQVLIDDERSRSTKHQNGANNGRDSDTGSD